MTTTRARALARLRELLAGPRDETAAVEARRLVEEVRQDRPVPAAEVQVRPRRREAGPESEEARWRRVIAMRRGGGGMSRVIWPGGGGRDGESVWTAQNEAKTYLRRSSPWGR